MPVNPGEDDAPQAPAGDSIALETFAGLRNTILPERLGPRELARARNVYLDDAGQMHRRRGVTRVADGAWHSLFRAGTVVLGVNGDTLCELLPDFSTRALVAGMSSRKLSWEYVDKFAYFTSRDVSGKVYLPNMQVTPWGFRADHDYRPSTIPEIGRTFWLTPVPFLEEGLGPVGGRLLGPPPLGDYVCYFQGRLYIAQGSTLWATELYGYNFVDKTSGYRQFEDEITAMGAVEDGLYVGTRSGLYFVSGAFLEHRRTMRARGGVIPGTMVVVPSEVVDPEGRRRPDVPQESGLAIACMTSEGMLVGMKGGQTFNLTRSAYKFPAAVTGAAMFREDNGTNTMVAVLDSGGSPKTTKAAFGDYVDVQLIRNGQVINIPVPPRDITQETVPYQPPVIGNAYTPQTYQLRSVTSFTAKHGLSYSPPYTLTDETGSIVEADTDVSPGTLHLSFAEPFSGTLVV